MKKDKIIEMIDILYRSKKWVSVSEFRVSNFDSPNTDDVSNSIWRIHLNQYCDDLLRLHDWNKAMLSK